MHIYITLPSYKIMHMEYESWINEMDKRKRRKELQREKKKAMKDKCEGTSVHVQ